VHDVEVTNRDECVTVKNPASNFLIEQIWCNQSGGSAMGSLADNTTIENIHYRNIYTNGGNQIYMFKSNLGSGYVRNSVFENFISHGSAYGLYIDQYWESSPGTGAGVALSGLTFTVCYHNSIAFDFCLS
jgi:rhamnogalacturonan hydrolase